VLVADRTNPKGAMLLLADKSAEQNAAPLSEVLDAFHPNEVTDILCMQERVFGSTALEVPDIS
jgi:ABC-type phosphate transport system auxiliary subunit